MKPEQLAGPATLSDQEVSGRSSYQFRVSTETIIDGKK
jgi:hypothetical protein